MDSILGNETAVAISQKPNGFRLFNRIIKRLFDISVSSVVLLLVWWLILIAFLLAALDTRQNGFFTQVRVGKDGRLFRVIKIRTMRHIPSYTTTVTQSTDPRITRLGRIFRKTKIDELPQLINVLIGQMSMVGPRPDVPGFADKLEGADRIILKIRPGITGPATLRFRNEEKTLANSSDPEEYNRMVIYPQKVKFNRDYIENYSFWKDISFLIWTVMGR